jgi:hypothetical protein
VPDFFLYCIPENFGRESIVSQNLGIIGKAALHPQAVIEH